jgi:uncharacterized membrane protein
LLMNNGSVKKEESFHNNRKIHYLFYPFFIIFNNAIERLIQDVFYQLHHSHTLSLLTLFHSYLEVSWSNSLISSFISIQHIVIHSNTSFDNKITSESCILWKWGSASQTVCCGTQCAAKLLLKHAKLQF